MSGLMEELEPVATTCPVCGSLDTARLHAAWDAPGNSAGCDTAYWQCWRCGHQWGHE